MGIVQSDHSKSYTLYIKVPNPIVTFPKFPPNENNFTDLRNNIHFIVQASTHDLPSGYWIMMEKLFAFLENCQPVLRENILKQTSSTEYKIIDHQLAALATQIAALKKSVVISLQDGNSNDNRCLATDDGFSACQEIFRNFSDENGPFYRNPFLSCPCLIVCAGIIGSFSKLWLSDEQRNGLTQLGATVQYFQEKSIQERLDNIKMLRTQSVSYNVHDYSYEAQIRKDVTFGGKINDFYDTRKIEEISFRDHPLNQATDADLILAEYKTEVKREYEQFFGAVLNGQ